VSIHESSALARRDDFTLHFERPSGRAQQTTPAFNRDRGKMTQLRDSVAGILGASL
jgi:hypothetical protein